MALSLSHPEKQMVVVFPCIGTTASQITRGVCREVSLAQVSGFTRISKNLGYSLCGRGKNPLFAAVWPM